MSAKGASLLVLLLLWTSTGLVAQDTEVIQTHLNYRVAVNGVVVSVTYITGEYEVAYGDKIAVRIAFDQLPSPVLPGSRFKNPPYILFTGQSVEKLPIAFGSFSDNGENVATIYARTGDTQDQVLFLHSDGKITIAIEKNVRNMW